jgi:hypothetical protein
MRPHVAGSAIERHQFLLTSLVGKPRFTFFPGKERKPIFPDSRKMSPVVAAHRFLVAPSTQVVPPVKVKRRDNDESLQ